MLFNNKYNYEISVKTVKFATAYRNFSEDKDYEANKILYCIIYIWLM